MKVSFNPAKGHDPQVESQVLEVELLIWRDFSKAMLPENSNQGICRQQWVSMGVESVEGEKTDSMHGLTTGFQLHKIMPACV